MKLYLDVSCLNRPFDDQSQSRIRLESEAVTMILEKIERGQHEHVSSEMALIEIAAMRDPKRRRRVQLLLPDKADVYMLEPAVFERAAELELLGFAAADAVHLAAAELSGADLFLSCDDRLCRRALRIQRSLKVRVQNSLDWLEESNRGPNS